MLLAVMKLRVVSEVVLMEPPVLTMETLERKQVERELAVRLLVSVTLSTERAVVLKARAWTAEATRTLVLMELKRAVFIVM